MHYSAESLQSAAIKILNGFGCSNNESLLVADHLIRANLSGHDSHGIGMLPMYGQQVEAVSYTHLTLPTILRV